MELIHGDCLEKMQAIPDGSIDMVLADPPYGTTACRWDSIIPFEPMWAQLKRIVKPSGAIVLMASQPFTSALIMSNVKMFKYCWVWEKSNPSGFASANTRVMKYHEDIAIFYNKLPVYNPIKWHGKPNHSTGVSNGRRSNNSIHNPGLLQKDNYSGVKHPRSVIKIDNRRIKGQHPTQKPVALMEYMIKTYTNEGETVLDFCMGSGTSGVACENLGREFIGIEMDAEYFEIARKRIGLARG
jgi:site-specific DNA-methyltransferase (adenine-specific)